MCSGSPAYATVHVTPYDIITICKGECYNFGDTILCEPGMYYNMVPAIGSDSIITCLKLSVIEPRSSKEAAICKGECYNFGDTILCEPGIYYDTIPSISTRCDSIITLILTVQDSSLITLAPDNQYVCQNGEQEITLTVQIQTGNPTEIGWYDGVRTPLEPDGISSKRNVIPLDRESTYWAYAIDTVCNDSPYAYATVYVTDKLYLFLQSDTTKVQMGDKITLTVSSSGDEYGTYRWYDAYTGKLFGTTIDNTLDVTLDEPGRFAFYVLTDNGYCPDAESNKENVIVADYTIIPNIITPYNENGLNDSFMTSRDGKPGYKVEIYNRYQQKVYEGNNGWNGTYRGQLAEPGTYYYRLFKKDGTEEKGTVEVAKF